MTIITKVPVSVNKKNLISFLPVNNSVVNVEIHLLPKIIIRSKVLNKIIRLVLIIIKIVMYLALITLTS